MAKLSGADGDGWVPGAVALWWLWVSCTPTTVRAPISTTAVTTPAPIKRPREVCRNRLDKGTLALPLTPTDYGRNFSGGAVPTQGT
ncbi:hypothetical protein MMAN_19100 [Mycobacterium mantenii]|uniref:Secreted protein n=1 Tax=Mycobacterium mantenii TaxID=560555 RepID=A0ABM7JQG3_MYCNT|nr:hypothetical protein MMAN_19100 [Mycobacterium mantenii]